MKKIFILGTLVAFSASLSAQTKGSWMRSERHQQHAKQVSALLQPQQAMAVQKPTGTQERVIAQVITEPDFFDSVSFSYSGTRGSRFDYNNLELMYNYELSSDYAPIPGIYGYGKPMDMLADSIIAIDGEEGLYSMIVGSYRDDNKLDSVYDFGYRKVLNSYDENAYLVGQTTFYIDEDGVIEADGPERKISYNAGYTQVTGDSLFSNGDVIAYTEHIYGSDDLVDTISWYWEGGSGMELNSRAILSYDAEGRVTTMELEDFISGVSSYKTVDTLSYVGNSVDFSSWISHYEEEGTLVETTVVEKSFDSEGQIDTVFITRNDIVEEETITMYGIFAYTAMNNPETITAYIQGIPVALATFKFYYETYEDGGSGIEQTQSDFAFEAYPNPFTRELFLSLDRESTTEALTIRLVDLQGRDVYSTTAQLQNGTQKLQLPELAEGIYQLLLQDASGKTATKKLVKIN